MNILVARARARRRGGKALALAGLGVLLGGADLGGHLPFGIGVNINRTAWEQPPQQWTPVLADTELADGKPRKADAGGAPVLLYRTAGTVSGGRSVAGDASSGRTTRMAIQRVLPG